MSLKRCYPSQSQPSFKQISQWPIFRRKGHEKTIILKPEVAATGVILNIVNKKRHLSPPLIALMFLMWHFQPGGSCRLCRLPLSGCVAGHNSWMSNDMMIETINYSAFLKCWSLHRSYKFSHMLIKFFTIAYKVENSPSLVKKSMEICLRPQN